MSDDAADSMREMVDAIYQAESRRVLATLIRLLGDFDLAEEALQDAFTAALAQWPQSGVPANPRAWLVSAGHFKAIDNIRRRARFDGKLEVLGAQLDASAGDPDRQDDQAGVEDDRLRLIFTCCHPSLAKDAQIALTLRAVAGLTTEEIARAFLVPEPTLAKRIVRAKQKIVASGMTYRVPAFDELRSRLDEVLTVIYLVFNEGYLATAGEAPIRRDLARDAEWLAGLVVNLLPNEPEPQGLLALIRLQLARWPARLNANGEFVLLQDQDRSLWDRRQIAEALRALERTAARGEPGRYQLEAAIAGVHCEAPTWAATNWHQVLEFYSMLMAVDPSPVVALNRAIAMRYVHGALRALQEVDRLAEALDRYHLFHATRAALLMDLGRHADARMADARALQLTKNPAERALLGNRLTGER